MKLEEQIVLVTGGARGVGAAVIRAFAAQGARVVINFRASETAARELVDEFPEQAVVSHHEISFRGQCPRCAAKAQNPKSKNQHRK